MSAQERASILARELKEAMKDIKAAEARAKRLSEELVQVLTQAREEAEAARTIVQYPTGRYECASCGQSTLFTKPTRELPACDNCGNRKFVGHEPTITKIEPAPPKKYTAGMYECGACGARTVVVANTDELSPCDFCGMAELKSLEVR